MYLEGEWTIEFEPDEESVDYGILKGGWGELRARFLEPLFSPLPPLSLSLPRIPHLILEIEPLMSRFGK
jgi:hypothetical protein